MTTEIVSAKLTETRIQIFQTSLQPSAFAFTLDSRLRGNDDLGLLRIDANFPNSTTMMHASSVHQDAKMRTTIDLPEDLHAIAVSLARNQQTSMSAVVADLMRRALDAQPDEQPIGKIIYYPVTGLPTIRLGGGPITVEMVNEMRDDE